MPQGPLVFREADRHTARLAPSFQTVPLMFMGIQVGHDSAIGAQQL
jgi:hypothetical protein